jgi:hypothetical protein
MMDEKEVAAVFVDLLSMFELANPGAVDRVFAHIGRKMSRGPTDRLIQRLRQETQKMPGHRGEYRG